MLIPFQNSTGPCGEHIHLLQFNSRYSFAYRVSRYESLLLFRFSSSTSSNPSTGSIRRILFLLAPELDRDIILPLSSASRSSAFFFLPTPSSLSSSSWASGTLFRLCALIIPVGGVSNDTVELEVLEVMVVVVLPLPLLLMLASRLACLVDSESPLARACNTGTEPELITLSLCSRLSSQPNSTPNTRSTSILEYELDRRRM